MNDTKISYVHIEGAHNTRSASEVLPSIFSLIKPSSVIDIGCANGSWLKVCKDLGSREILGVDGISTNFKFISEDEFMLHDLNRELKLDKKFDLAICLEVAEHLLAADVIVRSLRNVSDTILFSAAIPGQAGQFHVNEQWPEYWNLKFRNVGLVGIDIFRERFWDNENILWWYRQNILMFTTPEHLAELGLIESRNIKAVVHPRLYEKKMFMPKYAPSRKELFNTLWLTIKEMIRPGSA